MDRIITWTRSKLLYSNYNYLATDKMLKEIMIIKKTCNNNKYTKSRNNMLMKFLTNLGL